MEILKRYRTQRIAFVFAVFAMFFVFFGFHITSEAATASGTFRYDLAWEVFDLLNAERAKVGQPALKRDQYLTDIAMLRASEVSVYNSHTRPDGTPWYSIGDTTYLRNENIATLWSGPEIVNREWTNSAGHYAAMISSDYDGVGIGCFEAKDGNLYWTEEFGIYQSAAVKQSNYSINMPSASSQTISITTLENYRGGIKLTWGTATYANKYYIYRRQKGGSWTKIAAVSDSKTSYKDAEVKGTEGTVYEYKVTPYTSWDGAEGSGNSKSITRNDMISAAKKNVTIRKAKNCADYIRIKWGRKKNVTGYNIYRRTSASSEWKQIATVNSTENTYEDKSVKGTNGTTYVYKVVPFTAWDSKEGTGSDYAIKRVDTASASSKNIKITNAVNNAAGIKIKWSKTKVADSYNVYRSSDGVSWGKIASVDSTTSTYKDTAVKGSTGKKYYYKVTPVSESDGKEGTGTSRYIVRVDRPKVKSVKSSSSGSIKVKWSEVSGAYQYKIYYSPVSNPNSERIRMVSGSDTSCTFSGLTSGETYNVWMTATVQDSSTYESARSKTVQVTIK